MSVDENEKNVAPVAKSEEHAPVDAPTMHIKIYSPFKVYFDGEANSITAKSATGPFDILPKHHNFITLLEPCDAVVCTPTHDETIRISGGMMHVKADDIVVFLDV